jgi:hypothetical protein
MVIIANDLMHIGSNFEKVSGGGAGISDLWKRFRRVRDKVTGGGLSPRG